MKILRRLFIFLILIGVLAYGIYHFGTKIAAEKMMESYMDDLSASPVLNQFEQQISEHPQLEQAIQDGANVDESVLPFSTKEEATKNLVSKFSVGELIEMGNMAKDGLNEDEKLEMVQEFESRLSEDELLALKYIAYKELNQ
ncbi:hypothetical protein SAMN05421676_10910 [Salinibacillus kushneri]|uniref:Phenylalanyl-tRNA synthetase subunit beta n=1 Tax=Salinibacillus kushneri TaxID=237682 RepID=A0A1I0HHG6_9BACI|nr:hypothetical protein [Salinibacillus kushneri]SET83341.1 hypothetical protein SAMN05421676_10910 [Salinibacillus kushneri]